jgi:hypothetical protein
VSRSRSARQLRKYLLDKYGPVCQICIALKRTGKVTRIDLDSINGPMSYSVDHILALADGGEDTRENKQPAHRLCNSVKGSSKDNRLHRMPVLPGSRRYSENKILRQTSKPVRLAYSSQSSSYKVAI